MSSQADRNRFFDAYVEWLTRNRHGAGFWDGDWDIGLPAPEGGSAARAGDVLTAAAHKFGESDLYVGDDGLLYVSPENDPGTNAADVVSTASAAAADEGTDEGKEQVHS